MPKPLPFRERQQRDKYARRAIAVAKLHKFNFHATKLARSGKLTGPQKAAITKQYNETKQLRRGIRQKRIVFVAVKSRYRRSRAVQTGTVVRGTNRGVAVSVNQGQIERTGLGSLRVHVGRGGSVSIAYGKTRVETVAVDKIAFARNPAKMIAAELKKRKARSVSVVINGYEARGATSTDLAQRQEWQQYTNDLLNRIADDMLKADRRRTKQSVREHIGEHVAFRFYFGRKVQTQSLSEFMKRFAPEPGEDFDDENELSDE